MPNATLSENDRVLAEKTEIAVRQGAEMLAWWESTGRGASLRRFNLLERPRSDATMEAFFDRTVIAGQETSVMGCIQSLRFEVRSADPLPSQAVMDDFAHRRYFTGSRWTHPDGYPGGFGYESILSRRKDGAVAALARDAAIDAEAVNRDLAWQLLTVDIFDFMRTALPSICPFQGPISQVIRESAYIVLAPEYLKCHFPGEGVRVQSCLGYSFAPATVHANFFGFGPGRFGTAIKMFRFGFTGPRQARIDLAFLVAPRSEKVLYLGGFDPIYTSIHLADAMTLGALGIRKSAQDQLDTIFMRQHGDVHLNFLQGLRPAWDKHNWNAAG